MGQLAQKGCFSPRERAVLATIARTVIPPGHRLPGAGPDTVDRLDTFFSGFPPTVARGYRALLWSLEGAAMLRHGRPLHRLSEQKQLAFLESWRTADYARRMAVRALLTPLKTAYCDDPAIYGSVGCVFGSQPTKAEPRRYMERVTELGSLDADERLEVDVVIVGTGAGGAVLAHELTERGHAVLLLEEGHYYHREDFTGRPLHMQKKLWRDMGSTISVGNCGIPIPVGKTVGGSTTINSGTCYRVPDRVIAKWRDKFGLADITPEALAPHYEKLERVLGVGPNPAQYLGNVAKVIARGCDALGYSHKPLRRNAPDCDGQGLCCFGCPTDAKRSMNVSYIPMALRGGANLFAGARVEEILVEGGRAVGVVAYSRPKDGDADGPARPRRRLEVRARAVVIAGGTLHTPMLLMKNGLCGGSGELGKNLSIHPAVASWAFFDEQIEGYKGVPQGYSIEQFHDEGMLFEGGFTPLDVGGPSFPMLGRTWNRVVEEYDRLACFGFMIEDTSRGRVRATRGFRPLITYYLNDHDVARLKRGIEILTRVYFAAGAKEVVPTVHGFDFIRNEADLDRFRRAKIRARDFDLTAFHPLGTCRMGADPARSVVGPDNQAHEVRGLWITDGSAVPSSLAVNPQMTIMALSMRAAEFLDRSLS